MVDVKFGIKPPTQHVDAESMRQCWEIADRAGFDSLWTFDHFVPLGRDRQGPIFEPWTLLAAMAVATRRIRIGCLVSGNTNRHPTLVAKMATTIDHLSGGRLNVGIGAGGDPLTDPMLGLPTPPARERVARLGEACAVMTGLWTGDTADFAGTYYQLERAEFQPPPVQRPHPPLWIASNGERYGLRVVAEYANVWVPATRPGTDISEIVRLSRVLDQHCADIGRDPATIRRAVQFPFDDDRDALRRDVDAFVDAGFSELIFMIMREPYVKAMEHAADFLATVS
jgi:alkanesulfonate monooxygenase SsuD/methylene tetrahydromethanopterin reductase-like flavin-dependent oxidoreductase (luciferase family)